MEIERLLENLDQEEMEKLLPIFVKYFYELEIKDYICLYNEVKNILEET